jgi:N6-L-threonylcarbamoyladenine synthase
VIQEDKLILALESSCDETAAAVVRGDGKVLSNVISSQIETHKKTAGVVPEVAARKHVGKLQLVFDKALSEAEVGLGEIDYFAVTQGPGLLTALVCGTTFMGAQAFLHGKTLIPTNHIKGHILSCTLDRDLSEFEFPIVVLSVSGGHNDLYLVRDWDDIEKLGATLDDAAGEAYDKVAKTLGLDYPGGPEISRVALKGDPQKFDLPYPLRNQPFNFSFSGLKTNVKYLVEEMGGLESMSDQDVADVAASFQWTINNNLAKKTLKAAEEFGAVEIHLVGGVSANKELRRQFEELIGGRYKFRFPLSFGYCTDNAAMIGGAARFVDKDKWVEAGEPLDAKLDWSI